MADPRKDEAAARMKERADNAKTVNAVTPEPIGHDTPAPNDVNKQPEEKPENPELKGQTVTVDDPLRNDNRRIAEEAVVQKHGEDIRTKGNFEELVQEELVKL